LRGTVAGVLLQAVQSGAQVVFALRTYGPNGRPSVLAGRLNVTVSTTRSNLCAASTQGAVAARSFSWTTNYTSNWGSAWDPNWRNQPRSITPAARMTTASAAPASKFGPSSAIVRPGMQTAFLQGNDCSCYQCYWGGSYYLFGGYDGGNVQSQSGFGYAGYGFLAGYYSSGLGFNGWTYGFGDNQCYVQCMRCWYYGYPGYGMGYNGAGGIVNANGVLTVRTADSGVNSSMVPFNASGPGTLNTAASADTLRLLRPCNRAAMMSVGLGVTDVVAREGLDLGQPVVAATSNATLVAFSYSSSGANTGDAFAGEARQQRGGSPGSCCMGCQVWHQAAGCVAGGGGWQLGKNVAGTWMLPPHSGSAFSTACQHGQKCQHRECVLGCCCTLLTHICCCCCCCAGMGAAVLPATTPTGAARRAATPVAVRRGEGLVVNPGLTWGDNSAMAVAPSTGRVYAAVRHAAGPAPNSNVDFWVGMWTAGQLNRLAVN
jgi:hypothetical protein